MPGRCGELGSASIAESVAVAAARVLFHRADVRVSIRWGDPVGESGGGLLTPLSRGQTVRRLNGSGATSSKWPAAPNEVRARASQRHTRGTSRPRYADTQEHNPAQPVPDMNRVHQRGARG